MAEGYLTDTPYTWGYYAELDPVFLNYVCVLNGHKPRPLDQPFAYCDLGCGNGVTVAALAALHPHATFHAVDFNAQHIENAAQLAQDSKIANARFHHADLGALDALGLPDFDFVVLHGVYSWVDPETRNHIREFLAAKVKPGGVVYLSYDCLPGWAAISTLRELMIQHTRALTTDSATKAAAGLDFLRFLRDNKAGIFADNPPLAAFVDEIARQDIRYVAHEFFGGAVKPYYLREVATEMRSAGLHFCGNAIAHLNFIDLAVPAEFRRHLSKASTRVEFESTGDFIRNQRFRKDVYVRGEPSLDEKTQSAALAAMPFGTLCDAQSFKRTVRFADIELNYVAEVFELVIVHASRGAKTVPELHAIDGLSRYDPALIMDAIRFLSAGGQLVPFAKTTREPSADALAAERYMFAAPFNIALLKERLFRQGALGLIGPQAGIGVEVSMADALFALCSVEAPRGQVASWIQLRLAEARQDMVFGPGNDEGEDAGSPAAALERFRAHRLPKLIEMGILQPATV